MSPFLWYTVITPPFLFLSWVSQWQVPITKPLKSYLCSSWVLSWTAIGRNCKHVKKYIRFMVQSWKSHCEPGNAWMLHVNCFNKKGVIQPFSICMLHIPKTKMQSSNFMDTRCSSKSAALLSQSRSTRCGYFWTRGVESLTWVSSCPPQHLVTWNRAKITD